MPSPAQKSLATQKVAAYFRLAQESEKFWASLIVFFGALFLISAFPLYPFYVVVILALICGYAAYHTPWMGTMLSMLFVFPAVAYQAPVLALIFVLLIALTLMEMFEKWAIISILQILILAPFAFSSSVLFGWFSILGMAVAALRLGSKKSLVISLPAVFMILFLSSIWLASNSAFMPLTLNSYRPAFDGFVVSKGEVDIAQLPSTVFESLGNIARFELLSRINDAVGQSLGNSITILFGDSGLLQLAAWGIVLYLLSYLSGIISGRRKQFLSSLVLLVLLPIYYLIGTIYRVGFKIEMAFAIGAVILVIGVAEQFGVTITREAETRRQEKMKVFGKFGFKDVGLGGGERSLADIGGYEDVKTELKDSILLPLEKKELAYAYNIKPPSGILLFGPPGTGKTMLMRALAKELKYNFVEIRCSEILSQWYGESEKNMAEVFANARKNSPAILFFDEIDNIGKKRDAGGTDDVTPRVLSVLLQEMDGAIKSKEKIIVVGTTNIPDQLDTALLRPGRFDKIIYMHLPDRAARKEIFKVHTNDLKAKGALADDVDFDKLAAKTERFSGADVRNVVDEATKITAKEASRKGEIIPVSMQNLLSVLQSVKPSAGIASLDMYEQFRLDFERRVGAVEEGKEEKQEVVRWEDVAGLEKVKDALLKAIQLPLLYEKEMKELKIRPYKGVLLFGPPGTGKTLIVKAASNELKASFQTISAAELMKKGYTGAVTIIKETFNRARENTPSIIFVDEIETFAPARSMGGSEILGQFLTEMDGMKELKGVLIIAATNKPSLMDSALLRPGRFDKIFYIPPPSEKDREEIFSIHLGKFAKDVQLDAIAEVTDGFSGADIAAICNEIKFRALEEKIASREYKFNTDAMLQLIGKRRPSITKALLEEYADFLEQYGERS
jgi:SpoVK/Ycf46/Vps4 family AAA+-type ATPase